MALNIEGFISAVGRIGMLSCYLLLRSLALGVLDHDICITQGVISSPSSVRWIGKYKDSTFIDATTTPTNNHPDKVALSIPGGTFKLLYDITSENIQSCFINVKGFEELLGKATPFHVVGIAACPVCNYV